MQSRLILVAVVLSAGAFSPSFNSSVAGAADDEKVTLIDDCDPNADWGAVGGCQPNHNDGNVTLAEFNSLVASTLSLNPVFVGHPSWRVEPGYVTVEPGELVRVRNLGGRNHTLTKVAQFGGGVVAQLRAGFNVAPECATLQVVPPGERDHVAGLSTANGGVNRYQCCFHPWMRTVIKVADKHSQH